MAMTTHRTGWRTALAAAGMAALLTTGMAGTAQATTTMEGPGTGFTLAPGATVAADPVAHQTNLGTRLNSGAVLVGGQRVTSSGGQFNLTMFDAAGEGRIPLMYSRTCGWATSLPLGSGLNGSTNSKLTMQPDGNLVFQQDNAVRWHSGTYNNPGAWLAMQDDGNVVIYSATNRPLWASGYHCDLTYTIENRTTWANSGLSDPLRMSPNDVMHSPNGSKRLVMQSDGNLVIYRGSAVLWQAGTAGNPGSHLVSQPDGNIVLYSPTGRPLWYTGSTWKNSSSPNEGYQLMMQDDGNLVNYHWNDIRTTAVTVQWHAGSRG